MIVAKRGASVKYAQGGNLLDDRMKELMNEMSWVGHKESRKHDPPDMNLGNFI